MQNTKSDTPGQIAIDDDEREGILDLMVVIQKAKMQPFTTKSDFARTFANPIALAACEGLISTKIDEDVYTNIWMVTQDGLAWYEGASHVFSD